MLVVIRGAGDIATGIALRLFRSGIKIVMTDLPQPTSIRRTVCFSEAIRHGSATVEGVEALLAKDAAEAKTLAESGRVAVLADPQADCVRELKPDALVDAILAKKNLGTRITDAPVVVAVGPGFTAGADCHAAVETMRGHTLGRVLYEGSPLPNTGVPGVIAGYAAERVLRAPAAGVFEPKLEIGAQVKKGDVAAVVDGKPMLCRIDGCLRGLGQQTRCMAINVLDATLGVVLVWVLLPRFGLAGYIFILYFNECVNFTLSFTLLLRTVRRICTDEKPPAG